MDAKNCEKKHNAIKKNLIENDFIKIHIIDRRRMQSIMESVRTGWRRRNYLYYEKEMFKDEFWQKNNQ